MTVLAQLQSGGLGGPAHATQPAAEDGALVEVLAGSDPVGGAGASPPGESEEEERLGHVDIG